VAEVIEPEGMGQL